LLTLDCGLIFGQRRPRLSGKCPFSIRSVILTPAFGQTVSHHQQRALAFGVAFAFDCVDAAAPAAPFAYLSQLTSGAKSKPVWKCHPERSEGS
jgi:hypothetical protein